MTDRAGAMDLAEVTAELEGCVPVVTRAYLRRSQHCLTLLDRDGRILFMGDAGLAMLEVAPADVAGRACWDLWPLQTRPVLRQAVTRARLGEIVEVAGDGPGAGDVATPWAVTLTPVRDAANRVVRILSVARRLDDAPDPVSGH